MEIERQIFGDCFNFLKQNFTIRQDQEYWAEVVRRQTEIEKKYKGNQLAKDMLYACTQRLCEIFDQAKGGDAGGR